jgi:hypothetical protein
MQYGPDTEPTNEPGHPIRRLLLPWRTARAAEQERAHEASTLRALILARLGQPNEAQLAFVHLRFVRRLEWYGARGRLLVVFHSGIVLATIAAGLLTSGVTALAKDKGGTLSFWSLVVIALGVAVGLLTGLTQIWRPGQRSASYNLGERELRDEGWCFVHARGKYESLHYPDQAWAAFVDAVREIEGRATALDQAVTGDPGS